MMKWQASKLWSWEDPDGRTWRIREVGRIYSVWVRSGLGGRFIRVGLCDSLGAAKAEADSLRRNSWHTLRMIEVAL